MSGTIGFDPSPNWRLIRVDIRDGGSEFSTTLRSLRICDLGSAMRLPGKGDQDCYFAGIPYSCRQRRCFLLPFPHTNLLMGVFLANRLGISPTGRAGKQPESGDLTESDHRRHQMDVVSITPSLPGWGPVVGQ